MKDWGMDLLPDHYAQLLGLKTPWNVTDIDLDLSKDRVDITVVYQSSRGCCPECGEDSPIYDKSGERSWRHLNTMQFKTLIHSRPPRTKCSKHGVKTILIPWTEKHSGFTLLFEAFAIKVL